MVEGKAAGRRLKRRLLIPLSEDRAERQAPQPFWLAVTLESGTTGERQTAVRRQRGGDGLWRSRCRGVPGSPRGSIGGGSPLCLLQQPLRWRALDRSDSMQTGPSTAWEGRGEPGFPRLSTFLTLQVPVRRYRRDPRGALDWIKWSDSARVVLSPE